MPERRGREKAMKLMGEATEVWYVGKDFTEQVGAEGRTLSGGVE